jgi:hypothetical protein
VCLILLLERTGAAGAIVGGSSSTVRRICETSAAVNVFPCKCRRDARQASDHDAGRYLDHRESHNVLNVGLGIDTEKGGTNGADNDSDTSKRVDTANGNAESAFTDLNKGGEW